MNASIFSRAVALPESRVVTKDQRLGWPVALMLILAASLGLWATLSAVGVWLVSVMAG